MKTLYLDCAMGAAGDMLAAALLELLPDKAAFVEKMNGLSIPGVTVSTEPSVKCGIRGTHFSVKIHEIEEDEHLHHHSHSDLPKIRQIIGKLPIPATVKLDVLAVYSLIAEAESRVHGMPVEQVHFHEVGAMDAVADITAVCLLLHELNPDRIVASPVHVGSGSVRCAHGILPVPAPATALLLKDIPIYSGSITGELCTPTGAALLRHFATEFGAMPTMKVSKIGYGMGKKDFPQANCLRAMLGESEEKDEEILELACNLDDMTGEEIGFALERLLDGGALDAFTTPVGMKKSRPGTMLTVLCRQSDREKTVQLLFRHTTTLGIRETACRRHTLSRTVTTVDTPFGQVRRKDSRGFGVTRSKYEYDDLCRISKETGLSLREILSKIEK